MRDLMGQRQLPRMSIPFSVTSGAVSMNGTSADLRSEYSGDSIVLSLFLVLIIIGTIVGNLLVCVAVFLVRRLRRPCNYLLVSLAVSDLCVALLVMPMALVYQLLGKWPFGARVCDAWVALDLLSCTASILNLCMISVDRYWAITRPLDYCVRRTPRRMFLCVSLVWLLAACISLPPLLVLGNEHGNDGLQCIVCQAFGYQIYATLGSFYIPLTVMAAVYYKIFQAARQIIRDEEKAQSHLLNPTETQRAVAAILVTRPYRSTATKHHLLFSDPKTSTKFLEWAKRRPSWPEFLGPSEVKGHGTPEQARYRSNSTAGINDTRFSESPNRELAGEFLSPLRERGPLSNEAPRCLSGLRLRFNLAKQRKASTTLGIIMSAFTLCWLPFFVLAIVRPFMEHREQIPQWLSWFFLWLGYTNSLLNPVIYALTNKDFRLPFREIICLRCKSLNDIMREEFYQSQYGNPRPPASFNTLPDGQHNI